MKKNEVMMKSVIERKVFGAVMKKLSSYSRVFLW